MKKLYKKIASLFAMVARIETSAASVYFIYQPDPPKSKKAH
ncbi:cyclic lactone autoinducer peptide [Tepidibacillus fermentans]|uniref:Cyclic lactone autoinducer peptide n=1 Tax=Tepidibacillus fermentans TaxID=1281767 RepID=A0A4R3KK39_9BACI|nr:cyclic lactone autoinducer peptide [Tepidibacillus fermentans]TCS83797.1 cyclic lactone autoinducer peptide [Tepidibacillus fermentans]